MEIKMINGKKFELIKDNEGFILEEVENKLTDYYDNFDYIVGDWAYGKLRLKGFLAEENKKVKDYNNIKFVEEYIINNLKFQAIMIVQIRRIVAGIKNSLSRRQRKFL